VDPDSVLINAEPNTRALDERLSATILRISARCAFNATAGFAKFSVIRDEILARASYRQSKAALRVRIPCMYSTRTMRRTKASLIHRRTKNLRAVQLLLGYKKLESIVRHLGTEVDDALEMAEQTEV
jgi:hypothetical protein